METRPLNDLEDIQKRIGKRLREIREEKGIKNYEKFAINNDFSRSHYWNIEEGRVNLTIKSLVRVLNVLEVSVEDFISSIKDVEI